MAVLVVKLRVMHVVIVQPSLQLRANRQRRFVNAATTFGIAPEQDRVPIQQENDSSHGWRSIVRIAGKVNPVRLSLLESDDVNTLASVNPVSQLVALLHHLSCRLLSAEQTM